MNTEFIKQDLEYTSQDIKYKSQAFRIYIIRYWTYQRRLTNVQNKIEYTSYGIC